METFSKKTFILILKGFTSSNSCNKKDHIQYKYFWHTYLYANLFTFSLLIKFTVSIHLTQENILGH